MAVLQPVLVDQSVQFEFRPCIIFVHATFVGLDMELGLNTFERK